MVIIVIQNLERPQGEGTRLKLRSCCFWHPGKVKFGGTWVDMAFHLAYASVQGLHLAYGRNGLFVAPEC